MIENLGICRELRAAILPQEAHADTMRAPVHPLHSPVLCCAVHTLNMSPTD
jgi:hypothetical protein